MATMPSSPAWIQFRAVMKKNFLIIGRNRRDITQELVIPLLMLLVLAVLTNLNPSKKYAGDIHPQEYHVPPLATIADNKQMWISPCISLGDVSFVAQVGATLHDATGINVTCMQCELPAHCSHSVIGSYPAIGTGLLAAVVFDAPLSIQGGELPIRYSIRMDRDAYAPGVGATTTTPMYKVDGSFQAPDSVPQQYASYVLPVQQAVDRAIVQVVKSASAADPSFDLRVRAFPVPSYISDGFSAVLQGLIPIYITAIFTLQVRVLLTRILEEKEKKIKITLKIMGLSDMVYWSSWFVTAFMKVGFLATVIALVTSFAGIFPASDAGLLWLFFMLFGITAVGFCFALTTLFSKSSSGAVIGMLLYLAAATPAYGLTTASTPVALKVFVSLLAPCAFNLGLNVVTSAELRKNGITLHNVGDPDVSPAAISLASLYIMLAIDAVMYFSLAWYLDKVTPSEFGVTQHVFFLCGRRKDQRTSGPTRCWPCSSARAGRSKSLLPVTDASPHPPVSDNNASRPFQNITDTNGVLPLEAVSEHVSENVRRMPGVDIVGLTKVFSSGGGATRCAVDNLDLNFYEGQVTCLLGHNGAGKTTTISMLTGLIEISEGDAYIYGKSVVKDTNAVRAMLGVCPQYDILYDQLSVTEHLELCGGIKGLQGTILRERVSTLLGDVALQQKERSWARELSGGMKRRLSLAMAMVGLPKLLLLDEPTSGLDPASRRQVWKMIEKYKKDRVIVITTHFMDEADVLGDRVALMARGRLRVCGSPLFMKSKFGSGYHLRIFQCSEEAAVADAVYSMIPNASTLSTGRADADATAHQASTTFLLPRGEIHLFPQLFEQLEDIKLRGGLGSYTVSMTTLDDVFLRIAAQIEAEEAQEAARLTSVAPEAQKTVSTAVTLSDLGENTSDASLWWLDSRRRPAVGAASGFTWRKVRVIMWRKFLQVKRNPRAIWLQCITPLIFVAVGVIFRLLKGVGTPTTYASIPFLPSSFLSALPAGFTFSLPIGHTSGGLGAFFESATALIPKAPEMQGAPYVTNFSWPWSPGNISSGDLSIASGSYAAASMDLEEINATTYAIHLSYNYTLTNVLPVVLNMWANAVLSVAANVSGQSSSTGCIFTSFHPLPPLTVSYTPTTGDFLTSSLLGFYAALGFITIPAIQAFNAVKERQIKTKQLQLLIGATPLVYWTALWAWDVVQYSIPWLGGLAIIFGASHSSYETANQYAAVCVLLALYGTSMPLMTYLISFRFSDAAEAQKVSRVGFSVLLVVVFAVTFVLDFPALTAGHTGLTVLSGVVNYIGMIYPPYALAKGYSDTLALGTCSAAVIAAGLPCEPQSAFSWDLAGSKIFFMVMLCPIVFLLTLRAERMSSHGALSAADPLSTSAVTIEDDDVATERQIVDAFEAASVQGLVAKHLQKRYDTSHGDSKLAVRDLCLHVPRGEVLGLLGPNGAGKTTTLSMLVTDLPPTSGEAFIDGISAVAVRERGLDLVGYCPQFDSLFDFMTGRETLQFFAALNGVPAANLNIHVEAALRSLDLSSHADIYSSKYSGGNKRRLSLAIAYMGNASVVFLDECSTGVDPFARQRMFDVIRRAQANRTTVMTTHVMEEADGLCSKIGIMVDGSLACIGSPQHLKTKYGRGYLVEMLLTPVSVVSDVVDQLSSLLQTCSEGLRLLECSSSHMRFEVTSIRLPDAFRSLEDSRVRLGIADYNISQTTLEAVFLSFSRIQENINQASDTVAAGKNKLKKRLHHNDAASGV